MSEGESHQCSASQCSYLLRSVVGVKQSTVHANDGKTTFIPNSDVQSTAAVLIVPRTIWFSSCRLLTADESSDER